MDTPRRSDGDDVEDGEKDEKVTRTMTMGMSIIPFAYRVSRRAGSVDADPCAPATV
jgi:hypothetical protein